MRLISDPVGLEAVRNLRTKGIPMGGGWNHPTGSQYIRTAVWESKRTAVAYGEAGWPSQSYRLWVWEAE